MDLHTSFSTFDYVVIGCVLLSGLLALMRGLVREVCSLAAWAGAFVAAAKFSYLAEPWAHRYVKSDSFASQIAMVAMFFAAFVALSLVGMLIGRLVQGNALTAIDRSLGFVFGLLRGTLLVCLLYLVAISTFWPDLDAPYSAGDAVAMSADRQAGGVTDLAMPPPISRGPSQQENGVAASASPSSSRGPERGPERERDAAGAVGGDHGKLQWLEQARTRPFLARGARWLRSLMPANIAETARERKGAVERQIERGAQELMLQQGTRLAPNGRSQSYDNTSRSGMDELVNKNEGTR